MLLISSLEKDTISQIDQIKSVSLLATSTFPKLGHRSSIYLIYIAIATVPGRGNLMPSGRKSSNQEQKLGQWLEPLIAIIVALTFLADGVVLLCTFLRMSWWLEIFTPIAIIITGITILMFIYYSFERLRALSSTMKKLTTDIENTSAQVKNVTRGVLAISKTAIEQASLLTSMIDLLEINDQEKTPYHLATIETIQAITRPFPPFVKNIKGLDSLNPTNDDIVVEGQNLITVFLY